MLPVFFSSIHHSPGGKHLDGEQKQFRRKPRHWGITTRRNTRWLSTTIYRLGMDIALEAIRTRVQEMASYIKQRPCDRYHPTRRSGVSTYLRIYMVSPCPHYYSIGCTADEAGHPKLHHRKQANLLKVTQQMK